MDIHSRTIALVGAKGMLARKIIEHANPADRLICLDLPEFDITDRDDVLKIMRDIDPAVIINCAAYTQVDQCEKEELLAARINGDGPRFLAEAAKSADAIMIHISTDYVFSGEAEAPYREDDPTGPLSAYGRTKLLGEQAIREVGYERCIIVRTSWLYGPGGPNFVETILRLATERDELRVVADQFGSPTYTGDLAEAIFTLLNKAESDSIYGVYHFSNSGSCSWYEFAKEIVAQAELNKIQVSTRTVKPISTDEYPLPAVRPANSLLDKTKYQTVSGFVAPHWQQSLKKYMAERQVKS